MRVLLVGTGGVGESIAALIKARGKDGEFMETLVLSDYDERRAAEVSASLGDAKRFPAEKVNARNQSEIVALAKKYEVDLIMNGCDPSFNKTIFNAAFEAGVNYMDMAMTLSEKHPTDPYSQCHIKLGDYQFERAKQWEERGILAVVGSGVEPGMSDVFARYAEKHLFDSIEEIGVRDGANLEVPGYDIAFGFSIWTTIEECLNPPVIWEKDKGWYTTEPFSEPEIFHLPEGIGDVEMVNVEHEEVLLIPRYVDKGLQRVTFKFGLGDEFIQALKYLKALNLDRVDMTVNIGGTEITPRDFLARVAPSPLEVGKIMTGKTCAGTWVKGVKDGLERQVYLYQVADNQECLERLGCQSVVAQTAFNPAIMMELLAQGVWKGTGVCAPEHFAPEPFVGLMKAYGFPGGLDERDSEYLRARQFESMTEFAK